MITRILSLSALALLLTACSTMTVGQTQEVTILTPGAMDAECRLWNKDMAYIARPGEKTRIMKSDQPLQVDCSAPGNREQSVTVDTSLEPLVAANVFNGLIPGVFIDDATEAMYEYPSEIIVSFRGVRHQPSKLPKYHNPDVVDPMTPALPHLGPATPMVEEDKSDMSVPLRKIGEGEHVSSNPFAEYEPAASNSAVEVSNMDDMMAPMPSFSQPAPLSAEGLTRSMNPLVFGN